MRESIYYTCAYSCTIAVRLRREEHPMPDPRNKGW